MYGLAKKMKKFKKEKPETHESEIKRLEQIEKRLNKVKYQYRPKYETEVQRLIASGRAHKLEHKANIIVKIHDINTSRKTK